MRYSRLLFFLSLAAGFTATVSAQEQRPKDRAMFVQPRNEFMDSMRVEANRFKKKETAPERVFRLDFAGIPHPASPAEFKQAWHTAPVSQGFSAMCWCFSATSFFESEIYRLTKREIKLSELYTVYWEYVEKARRFVKERGNSAFGEGSEANAVPRIWRKYGVVPASAYTGMLPGQKVHDHEAMFRETRDYLMSLKQSNAWNEETVVGTIRSILDHYLGRPPEAVQADGKSITPLAYLADVVRLRLDDYVEIMSLMEKPYFQKVEYEVEDNWWHSKDYLNVPLDDFMAVLKKALRNGYSLCIGGDTSEPGYEGHAGIGVIPTFDIPAAYIDEYARQFRFSNQTTGDDHGVHVVGHTVKDGTDWFLIKDSAAGCRNSSHPGYYFYREDYVKLKMMGFTVHKDMAAEVMNKVAAQ